MDDGSPKESNSCDPIRIRTELDERLYADVSSCAECGLAADSMQELSLLLSVRLVTSSFPQRLMVGYCCNYSAGRKEGRKMKFARRGARLVNISWDFFLNLIIRQFQPI
jgi:hypothetical protein